MISMARNSFAAAALTVMLMTAGCRSAQDKANDAAISQAKAQAAATGAAQQVVWTDKDGNTITTLVQPPLPGQTTQQITTTKTAVTTTGDAKTTSVTTKTSSSPVVTQSAPAVTAPLAGPATTTSTQPIATQPLTTQTGPGGAVPNSAPVITAVNVHVRRGTNLAIRINQHINVKTAHAGERFTGEFVNAVQAENSDRTAIPKGTPVEGVIDASHRRGHFKGASILELRLTSMELNGQRYALDTHDNVRTKKGKGKRTAAFIGGGTGLGMLVGGLATGGVGLVVGGLAGAGAGTALGGLTGNRDIDIPAESIVNFRLADDLVVQPQS